MGMMAMLASPVVYVPQGTSMAINVEYDADEKVVSYKPVQ